MDNSNPRVSGLLGKRPREDFMKKCPNLVLAARKQYRLDTMESSSGSLDSDPYSDSNIYFQPFMEYTIVGTGTKLLDEPQGLYLEPKYWALAFMETSLKNIAEVLCRSVFTAEDLAERNQTKSADSLPIFKRLAITKVAIWMMNKEQDPWSYSGISPLPTLEELNTVRYCFKGFSTVYPRPKSELNVSDNSPDSPPLDIQDEMEVSKVIERLSEDFDYSKVFTRVVQLGDLGILPKLGNPAQTVRELTKMTVPENANIFVDAVQFSRGRWAKAFHMKDTFKSAEVLFRKHLKTTFKNMEFSSFEDVCPVTRLAVYRAVAWMKKQRTDEGALDPYGFDSSIPDHNVFLSEDEMNTIESELVLKYSTPISILESTIDEMSLMTEAQNEKLADGDFKTGPELVTHPTDPNAFMKTIELKYNEAGDVLLQGFNIQRETWNSVFESNHRSIDRSNSHDLISAGKILFEAMFSKEEILMSSFSGRGNRRKFCPQKVNVIMDILTLLKFLKSTNADGSNLPIEIKVPRISNAERRYFECKIFVEFRNYLSRTYK